jgi:Ca2+-binding RTX toxin-like protein
MGPDGSNPTLATSWLDGIDARQPSWSPDGTRLAITYTYGILIVNLGDGRITQFHSKGLDKVSDPAWSPDGKRLAFTGAVYDGVDWLTPRLYQSQLSGRGRVELTDGSFQPYAPAWSPDGTAIAFQTINTAEIHVFTVPSAGGSVKDLTAAGFWASPAWSPDGSRIAYESGCEVWTIATDGSDPQLYAQGICGGYYIRDIEWSAGCTIVGSPDADVLTGTAGDDRICGLGGNDSITGGDGNDAIFGGDGVDTVTGDLGDDIVSGGRGNDRLDGGIGADILVGGPGKGTDTLRGRDGNDILLTLDRAGGDVANAGAGTDSCSTDKLDTTKSCERVA